MSEDHEDVKLLAVDVALLLPPDIRERAVSLSAGLVSSHPDRLTLDADHHPHITLTQQFVRVDALDAAFARVAQFYERELDQKLKVVTTLLEPILILVVGLGICFIVLSLLLPIFEINLLAQ